MVVILRDTLGDETFLRNLMKTIMVVILIRRTPEQKLVKLRAQSWKSLEKRLKQKKLKKVL